MDERGRKRARVGLRSDGLSEFGGQAFRVPELSAQYAPFIVPFAEYLSSGRNQRLERLQTSLSETSTEKEGRVRIECWNLLAAFRRWSNHTSSQSTSHPLHICDRDTPWQFACRFIDVLGLDVAKNTQDRAAILISPQALHDKLPQLHLVAN